MHWYPLLPFYPPSRVRRWKGTSKNKTFPRCTGHCGFRWQLVCQLEAPTQHLDDYREAEVTFFLLALLASKQQGPVCWGQLLSWGLDSATQPMVLGSVSAKRQAGRAHLWGKSFDSCTSLTSMSLFWWHSFNSPSLRSLTSGLSSELG